MSVSAFPYGVIAGAGASGDVVTLSGETGIQDTVSGGGTARAGVRFNSDGTIDKREASSYTQIDSSTDWIIPNSSAPDDYEIRCASITAGGWTVAAASTGTWVALSSSREWRVEETSEDSSQTCTAVFEIRKGSGSAIDSATYQATATLLP